MSSAWVGMNTAIIKNEYKKFLPLNRYRLNRYPSINASSMMKNTDTTVFIKLFMKAVVNLVAGAKAFM